MFVTDFPASAAVDDDFSTPCVSASSTDPWLTVKIPDGSRVDYVVVHNRGDAYAEWLSPFTVWAGSGDGTGQPEANGAQQCSGIQEVTSSSGPFSIDCGGVVADYVGVQLSGNSRILSIVELKIYAAVRDKALASPAA